MFFKRTHDAFDRPLLDVVVSKTNTWTLSTIHYSCNELCTAEQIFLSVFEGNLKPVNFLEHF